MGHATHLQVALGYQPAQLIRNDLDRIMELQAAYGGDRFEATLRKLSVQYEQLKNLGALLEPDSAGSILSMQDDLARLENLYLSFNQLERLHVGSYEKTDSLIENQVARRNLIAIPVSILILVSALAIIAYLASQTKKTLEMQEQSEHELQALNTELESRIAERTQSLSQSRKTYRALFEQAPIAYCNVAPDGAIKRWNRAAEQLFGIAGKDLQDKNIADFYHPASLEKARHVLARFSAGQATRNEEMTYVRPDGEKRLCLLSVTPVLDGDGEVIESLSMIVDISGLREAQGKIAAMQQELLIKERLAAIGQLTATVSHELRNPLGAIRSATDALRRLIGEGDKQVDRSFALLERGQVRCDKIIGELLNYTRVQELDLRSRPVDTWLAQLLDDCDIPPQIDVRFNPGFSGEATFGQERMERALRNVIDNACHSMYNDPAGDTSDNRHELIVTTRLINQRFELSIRDTGHGIEQDLQAKKFDPLFTTKSFGVGLGLPIVKRIMEQHGGGITIISAPQQGTEVVLWVPGPDALSACPD
jgi:PAS domain S-box-containing protein